MRALSRRPEAALAVCALLFALAALPGCDGSNLFQAPVVVAPEEPPEDDGPDPVLRFVEEGTLLQEADDRLRFRWEVDRPLRVDPGSTTPVREREAIVRAIQEMDGLGMPPIEIDPSEPDIVFQALPPDLYRPRDSTRPWSFSRSFVTAFEEGGITEVEILLSLDLTQPVLERAVLHAFGHAMGIMGHPAVPGDRHVMATRSVEGAAVPTSLSTVERDAFRFLYSGGVSAGMTLQELRQAFEDWSPG